MKKLIFLLQVALFSCIAVAQSPATDFQSELISDSLQVAQILAAVEAASSEATDETLEALVENQVAEPITNEVITATVDAIEQTVEEVLTIQDVVETLEETEIILEPTKEAIQNILDVIQPVSPVAAPEVIVATDTVKEATVATTPVVQPVSPVAVPVLPAEVISQEIIEVNVELVETIAEETAEELLPSDAGFVPQLVDSLSEPVKQEIAKFVTNLIAQPSKQSICPNPAPTFECDGAISKKSALLDPTTDKIKKDLIGCVVSDSKEGYAAGEWNVTIDENNIVKVDIVGKHSYEQFFYCDVNLVLQEAGGAILVSCELIYEVGAEDWELKSVISQQINYVKTGFYDNYVVLGSAAFSAEGHMYQPILNQSASVLAVGGVYFNGEEWKKFYQIIPANCTIYLNDVLVQDAQIHFVEFPY